MIYKIKMMSGEGIVVESEEALQSFLNEANSGKKLILTKYGIVNVASVECVIPHKEKIEAINESMKYGTPMEEAIKNELGTSPFARLLSGKMPKLSDKSRTEAQEEGAKYERS